MKDTTVYVLRHEYDLDGYDTVKILGVYSDHALAIGAQSRFSVEPGFRDHLDGFVIHECKLDADLWSGGFVTERY
jgi:hypothetical protein